MIKCVGIKYLTECDYAVICENGFGCRFDGICDYQRPKITEHNNDYVKLPSINAIVDELNGGENLGWTDTEVDSIIKAIKSITNR